MTVPLDAAIEELAALARRPPPFAEIRVEFEAAPEARIFAGSFEDCRRLRAWLARPAVRAALLDAANALLEDEDE